ncbi:MAG: TonB-dependent receptor [Cytophagales bacterium]|jgi:outer membrane receptor protein involved in Fe transport|nr:TonB-dependent receptor [Bacteroidota bacterium]MBS1982440.1 TonB-dependent receptor [Bacteroidota bacterium]WHZ06292.1 MAG: TonB-dependent receptor [Cytophagales bacterium]
MKQFKPLLLFFVAMAASTLLLAKPEEANSGKITGIVIDSATNKGVEFANVALLDAATKKPVNGEMCDGDGKFTISKIPFGNYIVSITFIGYSTKQIPIQLTSSRSSINLGNIILGSEAKLLKAIEVVGQKPLIEEKVDRLVYNAESDATAKGGDATDVLRRVPLLTVDMDGNPSLRGSTNIKVLINNKPSTITASSISDALKQIPADQIKTVEVITSPSAKYDAEGSAGIINIVLKKNTLEGLTLNINSSAGYRGSNLGLHGGYRKGKLGISLGGFGRSQYNTPGNFYNNQRTFPNDTTTIQNIQNANTRVQNLFGNYTLGFDYDIDKKNSLTGSVRFGIRNGHNYQDNLTTNSSSIINNVETQTGSLVKNVNQLNLNNSVDGNLNYTHYFEKQNREFSLLTMYSQSDGNNNFITQTTQVNGASAVSYIKNINPTKNSEATVQLDYQTPINDMQLIEVGAKSITRKATSNFNYYSAGSDGVYTSLTGSPIYQSNLLDYTQNITAGYLSYTLTTASKFSLKAGTRYEYTSIQANTQGGSLSIPSYQVLVPSVNLSKRLDNGNMIKMSFNRRIQRPSIQNLNPNTVASNPLSISSGNPNLSPEYTNNYELGYSAYIKSTSLNFSAFMRNTDNAIQQVRSSVPNDPGVVLTSYRNIGIQDAYGGSVFGNISFSNKFSLSGGSDFYYAYLKNPGASPTDPLRTRNSGWVFNVRGFGNYTIGNGWGLQFFGFFRGRQVQLQGYQTSFRVYSLSLQKEFNEKRGSIGLGAENFFTPTLTIRTSSVSPLLNQEGYNTMHYFNFKVTFNYRIGKLTTKQPKKKKSISNDDLMDGGDQNDAGGGMGGGQQGGGGNGQRNGMGGGSQPNLKMTKADASAQVNATGTWNYTVESPQGGAGKITIVKAGEDYSGTITNSRNNKETALKSVVVKGNEITITYEVSFNGNTMALTIVGTIKENELNGNMSIGQFGSFPINAKKEK